MRCERVVWAAVLGIFMLLLCSFSTSVDTATLNSEEPMKTSGRSGPDLIVDYLSASWTTADAGETKSVSTRIKNDGDTSSGSFRWGLYLSTDTTITTSDTLLDDWSQSSISDGSTRSSTKTITIPITITGGYYYVGMIVDINSQVSESDENNNDDYDSGRITIDEQPDLTGRSCSAPTTGVVGDYLDSSISISIENDPGGNYIASSGTFYWGMYLSTDSTITTSDTQVGSDQYKSSINGGSYSSDSLSTSNRIPSSLNPGTYYWGYIVDVDDDVDEQDENNNGYTCNQVTVEDDLPDIVADSVGTSTSSVVMGDTISVTYRIDNDGHDYTGSFYWELYLSTDTTITTNDIYVDEFSRSSISPNYYASGTQYSVQIPTGISPGYYYLGMIADSRSSVSELDESNNVVADTGRIDIEEPADLEPSSLSGPNSAQGGQQVSISWRIDNEGDDASGWFYWEMYISTDSTITTSDTKIGSTQQASSINGGSYRSGTYSPTLPSNLAQGTYYWGIIVDTTDRVDEGDESNNILRGNSVSITVPDYDLEAASISVDSNTRQVCEEADIFITITVNNLGSDNAGSHYYEATVSTGNSASAIYLGTSLGFASGTANVPYYTHTSMRATLPASITPGTYYVGLIVDSGDYISESNENNNIVATSSAQLTVLDCGPDLEPVSVSGPSIGVRGGTVQVDAEIANLGMEDASNIYYDVFLSRDTSISSQDVNVGSDVVGSILMGGSWSGSVSLAIPSNLADGCWYWGMIVDPSNSLPEMDETNNVIASSGQFCLQQADLVIDSISVPSDAISGQSASVVIEIRNAGGSDAAAFDVRLLLSIDAQAGTDDTQVDSFRISSLASGATSSNTRTVTIPGQHIGEFHWVVLVDSSSEVSEDDESNNGAASVTFTISAPAKDLLASWVEAPLSAEPGQTVTIRWGAENLGQEALGFDVEIWLSADRSLGSGDLRLSQSRVPSLSSGSMLSESQPVNLAGDTQGVWWVLLVLDTSDEHVEDDENNNIRISNNTLTIDSNSPPPTGETLPGCDTPDTDGNFSSDAAATRSSAHHLGLNPNLTLDGCLIGLDEVDWYAFVLNAGNRTTIAFNAEGAHLEVAVVNGSASLGQGLLDDEVQWVTLSALNDDSEGAPQLFHIRISWDPSMPGGPYQLHLVTDDASIETDLTPPPAPVIEVIDGWTSADEVDVYWSNVTDPSSGLSHYEVRWAGGLWAPVDTNYTTVNILMLTDGRHSFEVRAIDMAGNVGPANATWIRLDRVAPAVLLQQADAQREPISVLVLNLTIDDGAGSGPSSIEWSTDNASWAVYPEDGIITWTNWSVLDFHLRVTDGAGITVHQNLTIVPPPAEEHTADGPSNDNPAKDSGGSLSIVLAIPVIFAIIIFIVATALLILRVRSVSNSEGEEEDESESEQVVTEDEVVEEIVEGAAAETEPTALHVADHTLLPQGGTYDQSSGYTAYNDLDGRQWWQQADGSFYHDPEVNTNDATQDDLA